METVRVEAGAAAAPAVPHGIAWTPAAPLARAFYARDAVALAPALLGRVLVHDASEGRAAGLIVEVEAYRGEDDPASHAYRGRTPRNGVMFGPPGHAYVYFTYGMHHCLNVVCGREGRAAAVLIRALEPSAGAELMARRRGLDDASRLARGPGCVARALGIARAHDGLDLTRGRLWISRDRPRRGGRRVVRGTRIGLSAGRERPWRFWLEDHPCVSATRAGGEAYRSVRRS